MSNRLASETSPYLLQHKDNPVDWYPWGNEALQRAQQEDKPILVSIGYSACHWCHVMAHETFENAEIAALMNANFINIKVDREERPDIDAIYMTALQAMSGQGGWPLNVFLTPTAVPFFGGTYWPPSDRAGMPGFPKVIGAISNAWANNRENLEDSASKILGYLESSTAATPSGGSISPVIAETAIQNLRQQFDPKHGGIGRAPKFPQASVLEFLLRHIKRTGSSDAREMLELTLTRMAEGGIYDHLGGGFARYSVDAEWLVPHFEKMLYDNAQLVSVYTDAWLVTGNPLYQTVVEETVEWVVREMKSPVGGFYAALDADSEGHEGKFYVWSLAEIDTALDPESADLVKLHYGVTEGGNFEGKSILHVTRPQAELAISLDRSPTELQEVLESAKLALLKERGTRVRPGTDTKIIVSWNALMIEALASAGMAFQQPNWIHEATVAGDFIWANGFNQDGRLVRTLTEGQPKGEGMLEDHAFLAKAFIALYAATGEDRWLEHSRTLTGMIEQTFRQTSGPGFFDTSVTHEQLIVRPRELQDGAIPCGNSVALDAQLTIGQLAEEGDSHDQVAAMMSALARPMAEHPTAFGRFLAVLERFLADEQQLVLSGDRQSRELAALRQAYSESYEPFTVLAYAAETHASERWPTLGNRPLPDGATAAAYLCRGMSCLPPVTSSTDLGELLIQGTR